MNAAPYYRFAQDERGYTYRISRNGDVWRALLLRDGRAVWNPIDGEYAEAMRNQIEQQTAPGGTRQQAGHPRVKPRRP